MERKPSLRGDLAVLAEEERSRLGEPPDAELLLAFHEGELPEEEMERVRDWLAVDPEWASIYLDLKRGGLEAGGVASAGLDAPGAEDPEVEAAWRALAPKLRREASAAEVVPFPRRRIGRRLLAVAAAVVVAVGIVWLLVGRGESGLPEGDYYRVALSWSHQRGSQIRVPQDSAAVQFHMGTDGLTGSIVIELLDSSERLVQRKNVKIEPGSDQVVLPVELSVLRDGTAYTMSVRREGASPDPARKETTFTIVFTD